MMGEHFMRVGTLNVSTLPGRAADVFELGYAHQLDILLLQESRLPRDSFGSFATMAKHRGWQLCIHDQVPVVNGGGYKWGVVTLSRWPVEAVQPPSCIPSGRGGVLRVWRPRQRPLLMVNLYLPASSRTEAAEILTNVFEYVASTGEDAIIAGDFNLTEEMWPISSALISGRWRSANEMLLGDRVRPPTHRQADGAYSRCIDFALGTPHIVFTHREQHRGPADHDLVAYDVLLNHGREKVVRFPLRPLLLHEPVSQDRWSEIWSGSRDDFAQLCESGDVEGAWQLLSHAAERAMGATGGHAPRGEPKAPSEVAPTSTKAPSCQGLRERQLRRLARRAREFLLENGGISERCSLYNKIVRTALALNVCGEGVENIMHEAVRLASAEAERNSRDRLQQWSQQMQWDVGKAAKWVTRDTPAIPEPAQGEAWIRPLSPNERLAEARKVWEPQWTDTATEPEEDTAAFVSEFLDAGDKLDVATVVVTATELQQFVRRSLCKATGMDGWSARDLLCLPQDFWEEVILLWRAMLKWYRVPKAWKDIRIALLAKPGGDYRPLSIGAVLWRALGTAACRRLRSWVLGWAKQELQGGLPGRGVQGVHDPLLSDFELAAQGQGELAGSKVDLKRCFDNIRPRQALTVCAHLGMPPELVGLIADYYQGQRRFLAVSGQADPCPIVVSRGLQQGCPFSVILVNAVNAVWIAAAQRAAPGVSLRIFLDDRTLWTLTPGEAGVDSLVAAVEAGAPVDQHFGMVVHPGKIASFGSSARVRRRLAVHSALLGQPCTYFKLLGIHYCVVANRPAPELEALTALIQLRSERVAKVARMPALRRALLRTTVLSLFQWAGPWQRYAKNQLTKWTSAIEVAMWGGSRPKGRSKLLGCAALGGPETSVDFALALSTLRHEWSRAQAAACQGRGDCEPGRQLRALCLRWGWTYENGVLDTLVGTFVPGHHTLGAIRRAAVQAWHQELWDSEARTDGALPLGRRALVLGALQELALSGGRDAMRVATACAIDGVLLSHFKEPVAFTCECGLQSPSRAHLTFDCSAAAETDVLVATESYERKLLFKVVPLPEKVPRPGPVTCEDQLLALCSGAAATGSTVLFATDGGCLVQRGLELWQRAAWCVVAQLDTDTCSWSGLVGDGEQTPAAGERMALWHALWLVRRTGCRARLLSDNHAAVLRLRNGWSRGIWQGPLERFWREAGEGLADRAEIEWIPSHNKRQEWTAPWSYSVAQLRHLNELADQGCSLCLLPLRMQWTASQAAFFEALDWSSRAAKRQLKATAPCVDAARKALSEFFVPRA